MHGSHMRVRNVLGAVVLCALVVGSAQAADRFVSTTGSDAANDCLTSSSPCQTIGHAITQAASGDTIKLAVGTYPDAPTVNFSTSLTISGSWSRDFTSRDPAAQGTTLSPLGDGLLIDTSGGKVIDLVLDGLRMSDTSSFLHRGRAALHVIGDGSLNLMVVRCHLRPRPGFRNSAIFAALSGSGSLVLSVADSTLEMGGIDLEAFDTSSISVTVERSVIRSVVNDGSAFFAGGSANITVSSSSFMGNHGTAMLVGGTTSVTDSLFIRNRARFGNGGGLFATGSVTLTNVAFIKNSAIGGGGIFTGDASVTLNNVTLSKNRARDGGGGGILAVGNAALDLRNVIAWGNIAASGADLLMQSGSPTVNADHCDIGDRLTVDGTFNDLGGNINADPLLVIPSRDFHLRSGSPCIDTGTCAGAPTTDFEGDPRPTGASCDMGADEFVP